MKTLKDAPVLDGTVLSSELTLIGKQIGFYLEYAGKIARVKSEQMTLVKNEKPDGLEVFLEAIEREEKKRQKKLTVDQKNELEKQTRYQISPKKLGNGTAMFNNIMHELTSENKHWQSLIDAAKKELETICKQASAIDKLQHDDVRDHL